MNPLNRVGEGFHFVSVDEWQNELGGIETGWVFGEPFKGVLDLDSSAQIRVAEQSGFTSKYTAMVDKDLSVNYGDIFYRDRDKATFRVTDRPTDIVSPQMSNTSLKFFYAEDFELRGEPEEVIGFSDETYKVQYVNGRVNVAEKDYVPPELPELEESEGE